MPLFPDTVSIATSCRDDKTNKIHSKKKRTSENRNDDISLIDDEDVINENSCPASSVTVPEKLPIPNPPTSPQPLSAPDWLYPTVSDDKSKGCRPLHPIRLCSTGEPESFSATMGIWRMVYDYFTCKLVFVFARHVPLPHFFRPLLSDFGNGRCLTVGDGRQGRRVALRRKTGHSGCQKFLPNEGRIFKR